ncbi:MAG: hypothetical protein FD129_2235 [bacterium]|nr:MAG: hypothetical protein FD129_2235 [bacterium]
MPVLVLAALLPPLWAPGPEANRKGNDAWKKGKYDQAAGEFARALDAMPAERRLTFNRGTALLGENKGDEALSALISATADPRRDVQAPAYYNAGNALFEGQKLDEALDAWKRAILADPSDENAKFNYELAKRKKQQEDKKKEDQKKDQKDDQKDQKKNQEQEDQQKQDQEKKEPQDQQDQQQPQQQNQDPSQEPPKPQPQAQMSKEQAERMLDALKANEKEMIKARMTSRRKRDVDKDW